MKEREKNKLKISTKRKISKIILFIMALICFGFTVLDTIFSIAIWSMPFLIVEVPMIIVGTLVGIMFTIITIFAIGNFIVLFVYWTFDDEKIGFFKYLKKYFFNINER